MKNNQNQKPLFDALKNYALSNPIPYDVPGHKMGQGIAKEYLDFLGENVFKIDVNSMKELDNLSHPVGVIKEAEQLAADLFEVDNAFFIVNGSTAGVQNMILSAVNPGETIILPRNIHKSAINALVLSGARPVYMDTVIDPDMGISIGVLKEQIIKTIDQNKDAKAILFLNPTYHGYTIDLEEVIAYAKNSGLLVLIDESHGTHYYLDDRFGKPSMKYKADMATISVHKTGGSLTQSSILMHNEGRISKHKVRSVINLMQTSSASYLLMSSLDMARYNLANNGLKDVYDLSLYAINEINKINGIEVMDSEITVNNTVFHKDLSKLLINTKRLGLTGFEVYDLLKQDYNIQAEVGELFVLLFIISVGDTLEHIDTLITALKDISEKHKNGEIDIDMEHYVLDEPIVTLSPRDAFFRETEYVNLENSLNRIAADQIMVYPPGIPLVVAGELITEKIIYKYQKLIDYGNQVVGSIESDSVKIKVIKEEKHE
jgi:arginine/lysine/ornithine decarboxylase